MPMTEIPEIHIPEIHIPDIHIPYTYVPDYSHSNVQVVGCTHYHRDTKNTGNRNLIIEDKNGLVTDCPYPSFYPLNFVPDQLTIVEEAAPVEQTKQPLPEGKPPKAEIPKDKKEEDEYKPCPPKNTPYREGDFKNELRLERLVKYERDISDGSCNAVWEKVPFIDQYIPTSSTIVSTAVIASVAATTPILLNLVKPIVKQIIKKLTKKKDKV